jgi:hypothetical protein
VRLAGQIVAPAGPEGRYADRTRDQHAAVQTLREQGYSLRASARHLGITVRRVRQLVRAATWQELVADRWQGRYHLLDPYKEYLHHRWQEGCTNLVRLHAEITEMGYPGSYNSLCTYFRRFRQVKGRSPAQPAPPSVREVTAWLTRHPDGLNDIEKQRLKLCWRVVRNCKPYLGMCGLSPGCSPIWPRINCRAGLPRSWPMTCLACTHSSTASGAISLRSLRG